MTGNAPSGTVTFLLTDLEGSTRMWEREPEAMKAAMARHDEILEKTIAAHNGFVFSRMGDGMATAFATAGDAISAAIAIKDALIDENWCTTAPLKARIGLHTAEAVLGDDSGYANLPINRCARLMAAAHGGQIVISDATEVLVRDQLPDAVVLNDLGEHRLRDLGRPLQIFQISPADGFEARPRAYRRRQHRGIMNPLHTGPCLAWCARALADDRPDGAGVLQAAAYAAFRAAAPRVGTAKGTTSAPATSGRNFVLQALRETGDLVAAAVGERRARELCRAGAAMGLDEAVTYALANVDPKLLTGPIANIDR
jgi:class 3 adenylate cyclase